MSEFRIEKRRTQAALTLSTGAVVHGCFFLAGSRPSHAGPERVADLLNAENGFFPFEFLSDNGLRTALINRAQVVEIRLLEGEDEARADPGYAVATEREVCMTDPFVGQLTFFRVYSGVLTSGGNVYNATKQRTERIGRLLKMHANKREEIKEVYAGDIAAAVGLKSVSTGDTLCDEKHPIVLESMDFPEPVISLAIEPKTKSDQEKLGVGLQKLMAEDPTFRVNTDVQTGQVIIRGMTIIRTVRSCTKAAPIWTPLPGERGGWSSEFSMTIDRAVPSILSWSGDHQAALEPWCSLDGLLMVSWGVGFDMLGVQVCGRDRPASQKAVMKKK